MLCKNCGKEVPKLNGINYCICPFCGNNIQSQNVEYKENNFDNNKVNIYDNLNQQNVSFNELPKDLIPEFKVNNEINNQFVDTNINNQMLNSNIVNDININTQNNEFNKYEENNKSTSIKTILNNKIFKIGILIAGICIVAIIGVVAFKSNIKNSNSQIKENVISDLTSYVGRYNSKDNNIVINLYDEKLAIVELNFDNTSKGYFAEIVGNKLVYENVSSRFEISKTDNGIKLIATADKNSEDFQVFNKASDNYTKFNFEQSNWNGIYINGNFKIIINEQDQDLLNISVTENQSSFSFSVTEYSKDKINYQNNFLGENYTVTIERTNNGIKVSSSSTDNGSLINRASGNYTIFK